MRCDSYLHQQFPLQRFLAEHSMHLCVCACFDHYQCSILPVGAVFVFVVNAVNSISQFSFRFVYSNKIFDYKYVRYNALRAFTNANRVFATRKFIASFESNKFLFLYIQFVL